MSEGQESIPQAHHVHITSKRPPYTQSLAELWRYRELVWLLTKRSFVVVYKQTILGPLWLFLNPLLTSLAYVVLFGRVAKLSTEGVPQLLFYLLGTATWTFFSSCVLRNATTFVDNANLFGKVYFPRLVMPVSQVLSAFVRLGIQLVLVFGVLAFYVFQGMVTPCWNLWIFLPLAFLQLGILGMGCGVIVSSLTTRYRDLAVLVDFGVTLWMYATPVVYPLSQVPESLRLAVLANPATAPVEWVRLAVLGVGGVEPLAMVWSWAVTLTVGVLGVMTFSRVERTFVDTV